MGLSVLRRRWVPPPDENYPFPIDLRWARLIWGTRCLVPLDLMQYRASLRFNQLVQRPGLCSKHPAVPGMPYDQREAGRQGRSP